MKEKNKGEIILYKDKHGEIELEVKFKEETIWMDAHQIASAFNVNRPAIVKHIQNIYKTGELEEKSTCSILEQVANDGKIRKMNIYNLDMIISVGYRVNSKKATQFRIWATNILRKHLLDGYTINKKRLLVEKENLVKLQKTIAFLNEKARSKMLQGQELEILNILNDYSKTFSILEQYDKQNLKENKRGKSKFVLKYEDCKKNITIIKKDLLAKKEAGDIFGNERGGSFEGIVANLYQTFGGKELYVSLEIKAAHVLYLIIKDHPFSDGNKRIAAFLFVHFLNMNNYLFRKNGERKINDNALAALALLIAESNPKEKDQMIALITQLLG